MDALILNGTEDTPKIVLDSANKIYEISGRSLPEDVPTFYQPVFDWIKQYVSNGTPPMCLQFKLEYFNTASSKILLDILMKLEEIKELGADISVQWHFADGDSDMEEAGEEYAELVSLPFELLTN